MQDAYCTTRRKLNLGQCYLLYLMPDSSCIDIFLMGATVQAI